MAGGTGIGVGTGVGAGIGVTLLEAEDGALSPTLLVATTMNVYDVPLVSPVNVAVSVEPLTVTVWPPGLAVTS